MFQISNNNNEIKKGALHHLINVELNQLSYNFGKINFAFGLINNDNYFI